MRESPLETVIQAAIAYNNHQSQVEEFYRGNPGLVDGSAKRVEARLQQRLHDSIINYTNNYNGD